MDTWLTALNFIDRDKKVGGIPSPLCSSVYFIFIIAMPSKIVAKTIDIAPTKTR